MSNSGGNDIWTPSRLRTQLAAQKGLAPAPSRYVIWRETTQPNAYDPGGYELPGEPDRQDEAAFERWLIERALAGPDRLSVSVLVIRENLDETGLLRECVLERRRGAAEGPYYGNVARVEFTGAAARARRYRAARDGRLTRLPADDDTAATTPPAAADADAFAGEDAAVHAHLGEDSVILDRRTPTLFEHLVGLSGVIHARRRDGTTIGCGVGWHGDLAFVLTADFPRAADPLAPPPDLEVAAAEIAASRNLTRLETRQDERGFSVIARDRGRQTLVKIWLDGNAPQVEPYAAGRIESASEDQRRWMTYAETYEARTILDSWRTGDSDDLAIVTIDQEQEAWRHIIDADGIEVSRRPDNEAAAAVLYRERAIPPDDETISSEARDDAFPARAFEGIEAPRGDAPSGDAPRRDAPRSDGPWGDVPWTDVPWIDAGPDETVPEDSLLTKVLAWSRVTALLRSAIADANANAGSERAVSRAMLERLALLTQPLLTLNATFCAGSLNVLIARTRFGTITPDGLAASLTELAARLRDELALTRNITLPASPEPSGEDPPFGPLVEIHFPAATYDIEEAIHCLALRRPTAAVLHATQIMRRGLDGLARLLSTPRLTDLPWSRSIAAVRATAGHQQDLVGLLAAVRRAWRGPSLTPADKYTEQEAAAVLDAVAAFMRALAARFDALRELPDD